MTSSILSLLPIFLFVLNLILLFILRAKDKQESKLPMVKKMAQQTMEDIERIDAQFKQDAAEMEVKISEKQNEVKELIQTITKQIKELDSYTEDMVRLRSSMNTYQEALAGLAKLTSEADEKIKSVESDANRLSEVKRMIEGFKTDIVNSEEALIRQKRELEDTANASIKAVNEECSSWLSKIDSSLSNANQTMSECMAELDDKVNCTQAAINLLNDTKEPQPTVEPKVQPIEEPVPESYEEEPEEEPYEAPQPAYEPSDAEFTPKFAEPSDEVINDDLLPEDQKVQYTGEDEEVVFD